MSLPRLFFPRFQLCEENDIADALLPEEHDAEAIDADAEAAGGGHSVFDGGEKIFVQLLLFAAGLFLEAFALFDGVVLFSVRGPPRSKHCISSAASDVYKGQPPGPSAAVFVHRPACLPA